MKVIGKKVETEYVDVEVNTLDILDKIRKMAIPQGTDHYSSRDWHWYYVSGHDYHKNDEIYERGRAMTDEEIEFQKAYQIMYKFVSDNKL